MENQEMQIKLIEMRQRAWAQFRMGMLGLFLMLPANVIGISAMYLPKYHPDDVYWYIATGQLLVGMSYFFPEHTRFLMSKILKLKEQK